MRSLGGNASLSSGTVLQMKSRAILALASLVGISVFAQQTPKAQMKLRILIEKNIYALNERVIVKSEFTNLTSKTLCFPVPDQECERTATGWVITKGKPIGAGDYDLFICHSDGGGPTRAEVESDIKQKWIKLPPNTVYVTRPAQADAALSQPGEWKLKASYNPPVGAFSDDYEKMLQSATEGEGCILPGSKVIAEPKTITVLSPQD